MKVLNVKYLGAQVGVLAEARGGIVFEYDPVFLRSGHELSPLELPLGPGIRQRDSGGSMRLLGLFEDSLPDAWGTKIMTEWFQRHGTPEHAITPLAKLAYIGARGMGALTYEPSQDPGDASSGPLSLGQLYTSAEQADQGGPIDLNVLAAVGSSAGGARPKALIALPEAPVHSNQRIIRLDYWNLILICEDKEIKTSAIMSNHKIIPNSNCQRSHNFIVIRISRAIGIIKNRDRVNNTVTKAERKALKVLLRVVRFNIKK